MSIVKYNIIDLIKRRGIEKKSGHSHRMSLLNKQPRTKHILESRDRQTVWMRRRMQRVQVQQAAHQQQKNQEEDRSN